MSEYLQPRKDPRTQVAVLRAQYFYPNNPKSAESELDQLQESVFSANMNLSMLEIGV